MLSYKDWKIMNESFGGAYTLGLKTPQTVGGVVGANTYSVDEAKKKMLGKVDTDAVPPKKPLEDDEVPEDEAPKDDKAPEDEAPKDDKVPEDEAPKDEPEIDGDEGDEDEEEVPEGDELTGIKAKCGKKCSKKKMTKEDRNWWDSVHNMLNVNDVDKKFDSGLTEDMLVALSNDPNNQLQQTEIQPGEPGWAPQGKVGSL